MDGHKSFRTRELDGDNLSRAYPILEALGGRSAVGDWIRFVNARDEASGSEPPRSGVLAVEDHKGYLLGLFCYQVVESPLRGRTLECENFAVPDLVRSNLPFETLIDDAERLARLYDCRYLSVSIATTEPQGAMSPAMRDHLERRSFGFDSIRFSKTLAPRDSSLDVGPLDAP
jgi:hypothetical protein